jgi:ribonuclease E
MKKEMLINVLEPEECRIAILEDGVLEELYVERTSHESYVGNIYKGRIVNIEPSIQAAFVDFGVGRNGFLHVSDVEPTYYRHLMEGSRRREEDFDDRRAGRNGRGEGRGDRRERSRGGKERRSEPRGQTPTPAGTLDSGKGKRRPAPQEEPARPFGAGILDEEIAEGAPEFSPPGEPPAGEPETGIEPGQPLQEKVEEPVTGEEWPTPPPEAPEAEAPAEEPAEEEGMALEAPPGPQAELPAEEVPAPRTRKRTRSSSGTTGRKRTASRGRRAKAGPEAGEGEAGEPEAGEGKAPPSGEEADPPSPPLMDSAEHRTSPRDSDPEYAPEITGSLGGDLAEDEDLLFSARPEEPPEEMEEKEPEEQEPEPWEEEAEAAPFPGEELAPLRADEDLPKRARPARSGRSIEAELEEDLRAMEVEASPAEEVRSFPQERPAEPEEEPSSVPIEDFDIAHSPLLDEPLAEREPERGRGRGRERGRGGERGERGGDRRRGRRGRDGGRPGTGRDRPPIQEIFKRGQEVIVQVIKEGIGTKGPTLSTYISIAGRYLVLTPWMGRVGVSRKIQDEEARRRLRDIFHDLKPPRGLGFIIRTAGIDKEKKELQRDLTYLLRLWQVVARRIRKAKSPAEIYQESDMITRTIRDTFTNDIDTIYVDEPTAFEHAQEFFQVVMPRFANRLKLYEDKEPLFHRYSIEEEITRIHQRKIPLPQGGSIVIEQTEALVAIDVNSGNFRADNNAEETAYQMNLLAAREIARQLRLRDLGGVIVNDFIDMRDEKHRRGVERALRDAIKRDRARTKILKISAFGIIEMTRQRIRPSLKRSVYQECAHCHGTGHVKTPESMSIEVMRLLQLAAYREHIQRIEVRVTQEVANYLLNRKRADITRLEQGGEIQVTVSGIIGAPLETLEFFCYDANGHEVKFMPLAVPTRPQRR